MTSLPSTVSFILIDLIILISLYFAVEMVPAKDRDYQWWKRTKKRTFWIFLGAGPLIGCLTITLSACTVLTTVAFLPNPTTGRDPSETLGLAVYLFYFAFLALPLTIPLAYLAGLVPAALTAFLILVWFRNKGTTPLFIPLSFAVLMTVLTVFFSDLIQSNMPGALLRRPLVSNLITFLTFLAPSYFCWRSLRWIY
ncbi:hypothetical protein N9K16_01380 [Alphaproteobacteria bacterium]|jgi:hypothetical protein|nr:hypothetical protein [Alphaproteobacteria bacterium]